MSNFDRFFNDYLHNVGRFPDERTLGLEHEGVLVDENSRLSCSYSDFAQVIDRQQLRKLGVNVERELSRFSFELNGFLVENSFNGLLKLQRNLKIATDLARDAAGQLNLTTQYRGIPECLRESDLTSDVLSQSPRILKLEKAWQETWDALPEDTKGLLNLDGYSPRSVAITGCCSSSQFHHSLPPSDAEAVKVWKAAHIATIPLVALTANSSTFLGKPIFGEPRNIIWKYLDDLGRGRVFYGPLASDSCLEILNYYASIAELNLHDDAPTDDFERFNRHAKSLWPFIRLVLDRNHWRIENRAVASDTPEKTIANFALYLGLLENTSDILKYFDLDEANLETNFLEVCKFGLREMSKLGGNLSLKTTRELIVEIALKGLKSRGMSDDLLHQFRERKFSLQS